jgi:hypothetical protein
MTYTASAAQAGRSSLLSIGGTPTLIGEVKSVSLNRGEWQTIDVTNFQSGVEQEWISTIRNSGTVAVKFNRVSADAGQAAVETAYISGAVTAFVLELPKVSGQVTHGDRYSFSAIVTKSNFTDEVKSVIEGDVELKITGSAPPLTAGA